MPPLEKLKAVPSLGVSRFQDPVEPTRGPELLDPPGELRSTDPVGELPTRLPALGDFENRGPEAVAIPNADISLGHPEGRDILPEETGFRELFQSLRILPAPQFVVVVGVVMDRLVRAPVVFLVRLGVSRETLGTDEDWFSNRLFANCALSPPGAEGLGRSHEEGRCCGLLHRGVFYTNRTYSLQKARIWHILFLKVSDEHTKDFDFSDETGISEEDRKEISERIEAIARESRIEVTPALFAFKGTRKAATLPILANVVGLVLIVLGVLGAYYAFQQREAEISSSQGTFSTAEGRLIAELRRQTEEELNSKDQQMVRVQRQLSDVQVERDQILSEIEERVRRREEELRQALIQELDSERQRLVRAGESESRIAERLSTLESSLAEENAEALAEFQAELEEEYATNLARLRALQRQYEEELRALQQERLAISRDSETREQEIRQQIVVQQSQGGTEERPPQTIVMEAPPADSPELIAAREELARIAEAENQEALVDAQINGLYRDIAQRVVDEEYTRALNQLATLRTLITDPDFSSLPGMRQRLEVDLTVARALEALIQEQMADRDALNQATAVFGQLRGHVEDAQEYARRGDESAARDAYLAAFRVLPEVAEGYSFLAGLEDAGSAARAAQFNELEAEAAAALEEEDYETALARYGEAVSLLTVSFLSASERQAIQQNLSDAGSRMMAVTTTTEEERQAFEAEISGLRQRVVGLESAAAGARAPAQTAAPGATGPQDSAAAQLLIDQANANLAAGSYQPALSRYVSVVENYPTSTQVDDAVDGINATVRAEQAARREEIAALRQEVEELEAEQQELVTQMGQIEQLSSRYQVLISRFQDYVEREDQILAQGGTGSLAEAKLELDAFLTAPPVTQSFPGLFDRFSRYQRAFEAEGRENAILEMIDVVYSLSAYDSPRQKQAFLEAEIGRTGEGSFLGDFLIELSYLVQG